MPRPFVLLTTGFTIALLSLAGCGDGGGSSAAEETVRHTLSEHIGDTYTITEMNFEVFPDAIGGLTRVNVKAALKLQKPLYESKVRWDKGAAQAKLNEYGLDKDDIRKYYDELEKPLSETVRETVRPWLRLRTIPGRVYHTLFRIREFVLRNTNTGTVVEQSVPVDADGAPIYRGEFTVHGVPGTVNSPR